jgi:predicted GH43/DUF377 family glycosyl hydrolase
MFRRFEGNPILKPIPESDWESLMVYNCAAVEIEGKINIIYRGQCEMYHISKFGLAVSSDGFTIDERLPRPILENKHGKDWEDRGYEDPRATIIDNKLHLCYTSYGIIPNLFLRRKKETDPLVPASISQVQIGMTSIDVTDFQARNWNWSENHLALFRVDDKNCCLFPEKIHGKYVMCHRIPPHIWVAYSDDLNSWHDLNIIMMPQQDWEYFKLGTGAPPIKTEEGWLFIYHAVDNAYVYRLGMALLDLNDPKKILMRGKIPLLEPETDYEKEGVVPNIFFTCGAVLRGNTILLYYGGADTVIGVATATVSECMDWLKKNS